MKNKFAALILFAAAAFQPVYADAVIDELLVIRQGSNVNLRVNVVNPAATAQEGPVVVQLAVRPSEGDAWTPIKIWNDIQNIKPGNKVSRDFFDENNHVLKTLASKGKFQAKATVTGPGLKDTVEKTSWYNSDTGK